MLSNNNTSDIIETLGKKIDEMHSSIIDVVQSERDDKVNTQFDNEKKSYWINQNTGEKIDSNKIYMYGDIKAKFDSDRIYVDYKLPDGNTTYCEIDTKSGAVSNIKYAHPLNEYRINIPEDVKLKEEEGYLNHYGKRYPVKVIHLKWGKRVIMVFDNGQLIDIDIDTPTFIDEINKIIYVQSF